MIAELPSEDEAQGWWLVNQHARFTGCAPQEESTGVGRLRGNGFGHARGAARCCLCASTSGLQLRDGTFRCRDREECDTKVAKILKTGSPFSR